MADLLKGLTGGNWALLIAWFLPAGITVGVLAVVVFPVVANVPLLHAIAPWDTTTRSLVAGFLVVALAIIGNAVSTPLYRVLEGYYLLFRQDWFDRACERHRRRRARLRQRVESMPKDKALARARANERLRLYPDDDDEIGPTLLQNALRALETFAFDRYGFDSQTFWTELNHVVPKELSEEIDRARASVDFFVAMFWSTVLVSLSAFGAVTLRWASTRYMHVPLLVFAALLPFLAYAWYMGAVASVPYWRSTVQALVNLGRLPFASAIGLRIPPTDHEERAMWQAYYRLMYYRYDPVRARTLDAYRIQPAGPAGAETAKAE